MKKIEAIIDPAVLESVKLNLAEAGIEGRLIVTDLRGLENLGRYYRLKAMEQNPWKPFLGIDLIVSDRQTQTAVNIILEQANLARQRDSGGHINILSLDATLEINAEKLDQPPLERTEQEKTMSVANDVPPAITPEGSKLESAQQTPEESSLAGKPLRTPRAAGRIL